MRVFVVLTSYKEEETIGKAVEKIIAQNQWQKSVSWESFHLVIVAPDDQTLKKAKEVCLSFDYKNYSLLKDNAWGKAAAMNMAIDHLKLQFGLKFWEDFLIFTDGDMYIGDNAIENLLKPFQSAQFSRLAGVSGRVVSLDERSSQFGYYSHLFCEAAHVKRLKEWENLLKKSKSQDSDNFRSSTTSTMSTISCVDFVPMSGYLYAIRFVEEIFPLPTETRAEDAYISKKLVDMGYLIGYAPDALAYVKFPKNLNDWIKQKSRSLGGNVQLSKIFATKAVPTRRKPMFGRSNGVGSIRSIWQDLSMFFFPLAFAKNLRELFWSLMLYPLRLFLWFKIYYNHILNRYSKGAWERIESSK